MRTIKEITEARALIERMIHIKKGSQRDLRLQLDVLNWMAHNRFDPFQVRLLAASAESERPYRDGEI